MAPFRQIEIGLTGDWKFPDYLFQIRYKGLDGLFLTGFQPGVFTRSFDSSLKKGISLLLPNLLTPYSLRENLGSADINDLFSCGLTAILSPMKIVPPLGYAFQWRIGRRKTFSWEPNCARRPQGRPNGR